MEKKTYDWVELPEAPDGIELRHGHHCLRIRYAKGRLSKRRFVAMPIQDFKETKFYVTAKKSTC